MSENSEVVVAAASTLDNAVLESLEKRLLKMEEMHAAHEETILELKTENLILRDRLSNLESRPPSSIGVSKSQSSTPLSSPRKATPLSPRKSSRKCIQYAYEYDH